MSRRPPNSPLVGNKVKLRGKDARGVLIWVNGRNWAQVAWDLDWTGPSIVHLHELETIGVPTP